jgi:hypothetical protein
MCAAAMNMPSLEALLSQADSCPRDCDKLALCHGMAYADALPVQAAQNKLRFRATKRPKNDVLLRQLPLGVGLWAASCVLLPLAKIYKPIWEYDVRTLLKDFTARLAYGSGTAGAFVLLARLARV